MISVGDTAVASGADITATLRLKDSLGTDLNKSGLTVKFGLDGGTSTATVAGALYHPDGTYTAVLHGELAGTPTQVTASVNGEEVASASPFLRVVPGPASAGRSLVTVERGEVASGNTVWVILEARDAFGNRLSRGGSSVTFQVNGGTSNGDLGPVTDRGDGTYRSTFTGRQAGTAMTVGATIDGQVVTSALPALTVVPGTVASSSVVSVSAGAVASGNSVTLALQARDPAGNNLTTGGLTVSFSVTGGSSSGAIGPTVDRGNGVYTASFTGERAGTPLTVGAVIDRAEVTSTLPTVVVTPGAFSGERAEIELSADEVTVGGTVEVRLRARDAFGNAITSGGLNVAFAAQNPAAGAVGAAADRGDGIYAAVFTGSAPGTTEIRATANGTAVMQAAGPITVEPGPMPGFATHEPPGWVTRTSWNMSSPDEPGWAVRTQAGQDADFTIQSDASSPGSAPSVGQFRFGAGPQSIVGLSHEVQNNAVYLALWWKAGDGSFRIISGDEYQMNFDVFAFRDGAGTRRVVAQVHTQCCNNRDLPNARPGYSDHHTLLMGNADGGGVDIQPGQWYRIEVLFSINSREGAKDGIIRWWVNGATVGDYNNLDTGPVMTLLNTFISASPRTADREMSFPFPATTAEDIERIDDILVMVPPNPVPGQVTDLQAIEWYSNAVVLYFHTVTDGLGREPLYEIRYSQAPISWPSATIVTQGRSTLTPVVSSPGPPGTRTQTCRAPYSAIVHFSTTMCFIVGLTMGTDYDFQVVAYRGTANQDAVYGPLSNVASATTRTDPPPFGAITLRAGAAPGSDPRTVVGLTFNIPYGPSSIGPLRYDVRVAEGEIQWGSAKSVTEGSCTDLAENQPHPAESNNVLCEVTGLKPGTRYQFQLAPYRGTLNRDAVVGPLSNTAETTTAR